MKRTERGQALVEFAIVGLLVIVVVLIVIEVARAFHYYNALTYAVQEGARFGTVHPSDTAGIVNRTMSRAEGVGLTLQAAPVVSCSPCTGGAPITVSAVYDFQPLVPLAPPLHLQASTTMDIE